MRLARLVLIVILGLLGGLFVTTSTVSASENDNQFKAATISGSIALAKAQINFEGSTLKESLAMAKQSTGRAAVRQNRPQDQVVAQYLNKSNAKVLGASNRVIGSAKVRKIESTRVVQNVQIKNIQGKVAGVSTTSVDRYLQPLFQNILDYYSNDSKVLGISDQVSDASTIAGSIELAKTARGNNPDTSTIAGSILEAKVN